MIIFTRTDVCLDKLGVQFKFPFWLIDKLSESVLLFLEKSEIVLLLKSEWS